MGSFGYTPHALCSNRAMGVWHCRLPGAPPGGGTPPPTAVGGRPYFRGIALAAVGDGPATLAASYGDYGAAIPAKVSLRDGGDAAWRGRELGHWAACGLTLERPPGSATTRVRAGLSVWWDGGDGGEFPRYDVELYGSWRETAEKTWRLDVAYDALASTPSDFKMNSMRRRPSPRSPARTAFETAARRLWPLTSWPDALARDPAKMRLEGSLVDGVLVAHLHWEAARPTWTRDVALVALEVA